MSNVMTYNQEDVTKIEQMVARFENRVSFQDILHWLTNFNETDREIALSLLNYLNFYTSERILSSLATSLEKIKALYPKNVRFLPVRKINKEQKNIHTGGQSGGMIAYYVRKAIEVNRLDKKYFVINENELIRYKNKRKTYYFFLVDDFSGSGDTIIDYYNFIKDQIPSHFTVGVLTIGYMEQARLRFDKCFTHCFGEKIVPIFNEIKGLSWLNTYSNREYMLFARTYGDKLFRESEGNISAMGYKQSQALLAFEYGTPDNTLPIIWASPNEGAKSPWFPIFPRNSVDRIDKYLQNKRYIYRWIAYASEAHLFNQSSRRYTADNIRNFLTLLLLSNHKSEVVICNTLAIGSAEFEDIVAQCRYAHLLDEVNHLTAQGELFIRRYKNDEQSVKNLRMYESSYIPHTFNGIS